MGLTMKTWLHTRQTLKCRRRSSLNLHLPTPRVASDARTWTDRGLEFEAIRCPLSALSNAEADPIDLLMYNISLHLHYCLKQIEAEFIKLFSLPHQHVVV